MQNLSDNTDKENKLEKNEIAEEKPDIQAAHFRLFQRLAIGFVILFGSLATVFYMMIYFYFNPYVKEQIMRSVSQNTDSLYQLQIEKLNINFLNSSIRVQQLKLRKDAKRWKEILDQGEDENQIDIDLQVNQAQATGIHWVKYLRTGELNIDFIELKSPNINFKNHVAEQDTLPSDKNTSDQITDLINKFSKGLRIRNFTISNANISFRLKTQNKETFHRGDSIQMRLYNLEIDKRLTPAPNHTHNIRLGDFAFALKSYDFISPNRKYRFSSGNFTASSIDSTLRIDDLSVIPLFQASREDPLRTQVMSERIDMQSVDFQRIFYRQEFDMGALKCQNLALDIDQVEDATPEAQAQTQEDFSLLETSSLKDRLQKLPFYVRLDTFALSNSQIHYKAISSKDTSKVITSHHLDSMNVSFEYFAIGKAIDDKIKDKPLYSKNVRFSLRNYDYQSPDGIYALHLGSTYISSLDSIIDIEQIHLRPRVSPEYFSGMTQYQKILIDAQVNKIRAEELDIERLAYHQEFALGEIVIQEPVFKAYLDKTKLKRPGQKYQNFEEILESIPLYVLVDKLNLNDASIKYQEKVELKDGQEGIARHEAERINLSVMHMQLGKAINRPALAELDTKSLLLGLENYSFKTPDGLYNISLDNLDISSAKSYIQIDSLKIKPQVTEEEFSEKLKYRNSLLDIEVANVQGLEIDFKKLLMFQEIDWGYLKLNQPIINIYDDKRKPKRPKVDSSKLITNTRYYITEIGPSSQQEIYHPTDSTLQNYFKLIGFFDQRRPGLFVDKNLKMPITMDSKDQNYDSSNRNLTDTVGFRKFLREIPLYIKVDTLAVNHGKITYRDHTKVDEGSGVAYHSVNDFSFLIPQIRLGKASLDSSFQHFYSGNILFRLEDYIFKDKYDIYTFTLKDVNSSLEDSLLTISELAFQPLLSREEFIKRKDFRSTFVDASLKRIQANAIDVDRLVFDQEFVLRSLYITEPKIDLYSDHKKPKKAHKKSKTAEEILRSIPFYISMDTFALQNAQFNYKFLVPLPNKKQGFSLHKADSVDIFAKNIELALDKSSYIRREDTARLLYSDEIDLYVKHYQFLSPDSLYSLTFEDLQSTLTDSLLSLKNLSFKPLHSQEYYDNEFPYRKMRYDFFANKVNLSTADFKRMLDNQGYKLHKIEFDHPIIQVYLNSKKPKAPFGSRKTPEEVLENLPYVIDIDTLSFKKATFGFTQKILHKNKEVINRHTADSIDLNLYSIKIDSMVANSDDKLLFASRIDLSLQNYQTLTPDELYGVKMQLLKASSQNSSLEIQGFDFRPTIADDSIFVVVNGGYQIDRFKTSVEEIEIDGIDFKKLINHKEVEIDKILCNELKTNVYRDKTFPRDSNFVANMPNAAFNRIPIPLIIDTLGIIHSEIEYNEKVLGGVGVGQVFFTDINGFLYSINTSDPQDTTIIAAAAKLMGEGKLSAIVRLALHQPRLFCEYYGSLGQMEAKFFNSMIESNEHIRIKKGHIDKINFEAEIKDTLATGTLAAGYRKLKIQVLKQEDHEKKRSFLTFLANMIINNKNRLDRRKVKTAEVEYTRTPEDGFLKILWKALSTGLVDTLK